MEPCTLCPRMCGADRSQSTGYCGQSWDIRAARAAKHLWEEPCISGTRGSGTVFFSGCTLGCIFCQNREISAGGFGKVMRATGGVETLVDAASASMSGSKLISATVIVLIGLIVTMGIGTSFGTVPVIAVIFVPLCVKLGFSPQATILMISAAGALGDAGSPASDATLGPTCGLNADGQHDHIWDTCVPTFVSFNLPLMLGTILIAQFL